MSEDEAVPDSGVEITLAPKDQADPPLLDKLLAELHAAIPGTIPTATRWWNGKAEEQWGKAHHLKAQALAEIARVDNEAKRDANTHIVAMEELRIRERELELSRPLDPHARDIEKLDAIARVVDAVTRAKAAGLNIELDAVSRALLSSGKRENEAP